MIEILDTELKLLDISVTACRERGEQRSSGFSWNRNPMPPYPEKKRAFPMMVEHQKHAGKIYRKATDDKTLWQETRFF